jgi:hypothetical protein
MGKAFVKHKMQLQEKVQSLFATIEEAERREDDEYSGQDLLELGDAAAITNEKLETAVKYGIYHKEKSKSWQRDIRFLFHGLPKVSLELRGRLAFACAQPPQESSSWPKTKMLVQE